MLNQILDGLLIAAFNGVRGCKQKQSLPQPNSPTVQSDHIVFGRILAEPQDVIDTPTKLHLRQSKLVTLSPQARLRHLYVLGATGTGKTNFLMQLIDSDIAHNRAFCDRFARRFS